MAFFFRNYSKPGPGVSKDEPPKAAPIRFFEILWRHLSKLIQLNLIFLIPFVVVVALAAVIFFLPLPHFVYQNWLFDALDLYVVYFVPLPVVLLGPFTSGMALITRNFAREEHVFVWSDFWETVKSNWKVSLLNSCIMYALYVVLSFSILFYGNQMGTNLFYAVPFAVCCAISILLIFAQYYIPVMLVTFDLKLRHIYKNALIFAILGLLRNLLITAVLAAIIVGLLFCPGGLIFIPVLVLILILFSFISYLTSFVTYSILDTYLIQPYYNKQSDDTSRDGEEVMRDELDDDAGEDDEDGPQYVYVNGRLIDRKLLKEESLFSDKINEHLE